MINVAAAGLVLAGIYLLIRSQGYDLRLGKYVGYLIATVVFAAIVYIAVRVVGPGLRRWQDGVQLARMVRVEAVFNIAFDDDADDDLQRFLLGTAGLAPERT